MESELKKSGDRTWSPGVTPTHTMVRATERSAGGVWEKGTRVSSCFVFLDAWPRAGRHPDKACFWDFTLY